MGDHEATSVRRLSAADIDAACAVLTSAGVCEAEGLHERVAELCQRPESLSLVAVQGEQVVGVGAGQL
ncbi:MAG TPA: hypothetical protein VGG30_08500 [Pirellulales bacterium]|jgi:hypothetical protein